MRTIEEIKSGRNYAAVSVGTIDQIIEHELPMGPNAFNSVSLWKNCAREQR